MPLPIREVLNREVLEDCTEITVKLTTRRSRFEIQKYRVYPLEVEDTILDNAKDHHDSEDELLRQVDEFTG